MRAVEIAEPGGPDVLRLVERPIPEPGPGEVLIRIAAAGVNRPDVFQRPAVHAAAGRLRSARTRSIRHDRRAGEGCHAMAARRSSVCAPRGWRLRPVLRRAGGPVSAGAARLSTIEAAARCPRPSSRSGPTCSSAGGCDGGSRCWCTAASSGIGTTAIQLARARQSGVRHRRQRGKMPRVRSARCRACDELPHRGFRRERVKELPPERRRRRLGYGRGRLLPRNLSAWR